MHDVLEQNLPNLHFKVMLEGVGHEALEEKPEGVTNLPPKGSSPGGVRARQSTLVDRDALRP